MADPIPDLYQKYGGSPLLTQVVKDITTSMLANLSLRRFFEGLPTQQVVALNVELVALALGHTTKKYNPELPQLAYASRELTVKAYEEMIGILRFSLLTNGFQSRDATIAINVLDMHAKPLLGVPLSRHVRSPFAGVDRRRFPREPNAPRPTGRPEE
jgi:hypothetical protein